MGDVMAELVGAIDAVCSADPGVLADGEAIVALHRQLDRLEAATTRAVASFDAGGSWAADGSRTGASWIAWRCRAPMASARRRVRLGRALRHMGLVEQAWLAGDIGSAHVSVLVGARDTEADCFERDQQMLVDQAIELQYRHFARTLAYWCQLADPDGAESRAAAVFDSRRLHLSQGLGGRWYLDGRFDPIGGEIVANELARIEKQLFDADWAEAKARVGEDVRTADLARTPAQRRADAMVEMARRSAATPAGARLPDPLFSVAVDYETFTARVCQLARGAVVTPGALVPWLEQAWIERVVFDGPHRIKNVGAKQRLFTGATRRAIEVRDGECFHPTCDTAACDCEIDHVVPYAQGGPTTDDNGRAACGFHNRQRQRPPPAEPTG